jgi:outer membrane receptor protein involved in Fe transport
LRAGYDRNDLRVFVEVQNLTDEKYVATHSVRNVASADAALLHPGAPLSVYAGVTYAF